MNTPKNNLSPNKILKEDLLKTPDKYEVDDLFSWLVEETQEKKPTKPPLLMKKEEEKKKLPEEAKKKKKKKKEEEEEEEKEKPAKKQKQTIESEKFEKLCLDVKTLTSNYELLNNGLMKVLSTVENLATAANPDKKAEIHQTTAVPEEPPLTVLLPIPPKQPLICRLIICCKKLTAITQSKLNQLEKDLKIEFSSLLYEFVEQKEVIPPWSEIRTYCVETETSGSDNFTAEQQLEAVYNFLAKPTEFTFMMMKQKTNCMKSIGWLKISLPGLSGLIKKG